MDLFPQHGSTCVRLGSAFIEELEGVNIVVTGPAFESNLDVFRHEHLDPFQTFRAYVQTRSVNEAATLAITLEFSPLIWNTSTMQSLYEDMATVITDFARALERALERFGSRFFKWAPFEVIHGHMHEVMSHLAGKIEARCATRGLTGPHGKALQILRVDTRSFSILTPVVVDAPCYLAVDQNPTVSVPVVIDFYRHPTHTGPPVQSRAVRLHIYNPHSSQVKVVFEPSLLVKQPRDGAANTLYFDIRHRDADTSPPSLYRYGVVSQGLRMLPNLHTLTAGYRSPMFTPNGVFAYESPQANVKVWMVHNISWKPGGDTARILNSLAARRFLAFEGFIKLLVINATAKATCIKRAFRNANSNPNYTLCRRRLLTEFEELKI